MTTRSRCERRPSGWTVTLVLGGLLLGCGGGGGGGGGGNDNGGGSEGPSDAQIAACQIAVQAAGGTALQSRLAAAEVCGAVVACRIRQDVDGTDPEACLDAATASCTAALGAATDPATAIATALNGGQCATLTLDHLAPPLGLDDGDTRCNRVSGGIASKAALAACLGADVECAAVASLAASAPLAPGILSERGVVLTDAACGTNASVAIHVGTVVQGDLGAQFDGIVDGFPGIAPLDGTPDIAGNQLGVGLKPGSTEERGIAEFPLAQLVGGLTADGITSAILTLNVDDVLSTFGPGTDFDGTAAERIQIYVYSGDGTIALGDFSQATGTPAAVVNTGAQGSITDATLAASGPVVFEVDLTAQVKALVEGGATHLGIVFATDDANSGTSIDDLGPNSAGPPGVGGAKLPFVTINGGGEPDPTCGDRNVDPGEECDDGNTNAGDGCDGDCQEEPPPVACGNGTRDVGEECDNGSLNSNTEPNACRLSCRNPRCGDDVTDSGEQCDDGSQNSDTAKDACRTDCRNPVCGDGVVDSGEECDPPGQSCTATCTAITVDAGGQFIACQEAFLGAAPLMHAEAGGAIADCVNAEAECTLADGNRDGCHATADGQCDLAVASLADVRTDFLAGFSTACVGRPPAELALALGFSAGIADCAADGLPTTTLTDVADCVFRAATCPVTHAIGALAAGGTASLVDRGALPEALGCAGAP